MIASIQRCYRRLASGAASHVAKACEGGHIPRGSCGDHVDQPDHNKEEIFARPTLYPARPLSLAGRLLWEPAASRPEPLLPPYRRDHPPGPPTGAA